VQAEISRLADTSHVEFKGLRQWKYDLQKSGGDTFVLSLPALDDASIARLQSFRDPLIKSVRVEKQGVDGLFQVYFQMAQKDVESFDYLTDDPSRLILDFYKAEPPPPAPVAAAAVPAAGAAANTKTPSSTQPHKPTKPTAAANKGGGRKPAGDEILNPEPIAQKPSFSPLMVGMFDGADDNYDRFRIKDYEIREDAIISSKNQIYLPFPMLKLKIDLLDRLSAQDPEYIIHPKDTKENKEARLLLALYQRQRYGVFLRTYNYFAKKYPNSEYGEILKNLAAHVHLDRWRREHNAPDFERAQALYNELVQKYPESPLREHNHLLLGAAQMEYGEALATLQTLQSYARTYPKSPEIPNLRKAMAEAYLIIRQFDLATDAYKSIIRDFPDTPHAIEAQFRLGDVPFARGDYTQAIRTYEGVLKGLPAQEKNFANLNFNMAEARFWQRDYRKALENYVQFVNLFPTHEYGGYALTRIGELLGILGADQRRVMGAYLESYFRFPKHPGAQVARIRMLSQQMRGMKPHELKRALAEIESISRTLPVAGIEEFSTLMVGEGLSGRGEYLKALDTLIGYYQANPNVPNAPRIRSRILRNLANEIKERVERGDFLKALAFYGQYKSTWLKNIDRIDIPYYVAGAYERAGAFGQAEEIYQQTLADRMKIQGTDIERDKRVQEHLPGVASLRLRLAVTQAQDRRYLDAYSNLKAIGSGADLKPEETIERVQLGALIAEQRDEPKRAREALLELVKKWSGDPALLAPVNLQLAQTYMRTRDFAEAENYADKVLNISGGESPVATAVVVDAFQVKGDAQLAQKKAMASVETYMKLLNQYESQVPLSNLRYKVGQILFERGDLKGASDTWAPLQGTEHDFLYKIGREKLADTKWRDEYKRYMNRIPAMASQEVKP